MRLKMMMLAGAALMLFVVSGCSIVTGGESGTEEISIKRDKAEELEASINIGAGKVIVTDGAKGWVEGEVEYSHKDLSPVVAYELKGEKGIVDIEQGDGGTINVGNGKNDWELQLTNEIPINLKVNTGASDTELNLSGVQLNNLEINAGVGDIKVDLTGSRKESFDVELKMGVGKSTIILPEDVGVKIKSTKGIGEANFIDLISKGNGVYVNKAYEKADVIINITTEMGVGEVTFKTK